MQWDVTEIFNKNMISEAKIVLNQGSTRSSKSYSIAQLMIFKALTEKNKRIVVARKTYTSLRKTLLKDFIDILDSQGLRSHFKYNKTLGSLICNNTGSSIEFIGLDDKLKIQGIQSNYLVIDEVMEIEWDIFQQLLLRLSAPTIKGEPNKCYLLYNPSNPKHWVKTKIIDERDDYELIVSTYEDNPFLSTDTVAEIEYLKEVDEDAYLIYARGEWSEVRGQVFKNWSLINRTNYDAIETDEVYYGLDWGFTNDYTAVIEVKVNRKTNEVYLKEVLWAKGKTNPMLDEILKQRINKGTAIVIADSAEPKSIEEFKRMGWSKFQGVVKGPGSVNSGIDIMKRYKIHVCSASINLVEEFENYVWIEMKDGQLTNIPKANGYDHGIDAARYVFQTFLKIKGGGKIVVRRVRRKR